MPKISFTLDEQESDQRSNEKAYRLQIENRGTIPLELISIVPRIPDKVELIEVKSPSVSLARARYDDLCSQLTELVRDQMMIISKDTRDKYVRFLMEAFRESFGTLPAVFRLYLSLLTGTFRKSMERRLLLSKALSIQISTSADAQLVAQNLWADPATDDISTRVFYAKIEQLRTLEALLGGGSESALATIEPDSFFGMTYILRFPRSVAEPRKYNLSFEAIYREPGRSERHVGGTTASLIISPRPEVLTLIAVASSLLGVVLKFAAATTAGTSASYTGFLRPEVFWQGVGAVVTALVFFNVYEFTTLSEKFKMHVGWRSALLIGLLCGLVGDRIWAALKTFVGA